MRYAPAWSGDIAYLLLVVGLLSIAVATLDPAFRAVEPPWPLPLLNALPAALLGLVAWSLTRRPLLSFWIALLLLAALYGVNALKIEHLETPLLPADFVMLGTPQASAGLLLHYLPDSHDDWLRLAGLGIVTLGLALWEPAQLRSGRRMRVLHLLLTLLLAITLFAGVAPWRSLYAREDARFVPWSPRETVSKTGLISGLLQYRWRYAEPVPMPDHAAASDLLARMDWGAPTPRVTPAALPDIVILQSESFFDASRLNGLDDRDVLPNYRALAAESVHGDLWVPAFGGGTIRTEFEVLTGLAMRYFPRNEYPYFQLVDHALPGLVSVLSEYGYRSLALHPNDPAFWNRAAALRQLGFDAFESEADFPDAPREGYFVSDQALVDRIVERLPDSGPPQLVLAISMELHGPYDARKPLGDHARRDAIAVPDRLPADSAGRLRTFLYHLDNADRALGRLAEALRVRKRRTLLLFYGDHLPGLPITFRTLGFADGLPAEQQPVPWLLFDPAAAEATREDSAAFLLPGRLLARIGLHDDWFALSERLRRETRVGPGFVPAGDAGLGALTQLRQRGEPLPRSADAQP
ncbi:MAG TPA: LTA synthase family protein [Dokdonella sp.]|uniref:LTA synthase family protein n=1 Tax=Dokdonella sp. TaxID=2291710 RepID=UPI002B795535|nr:LTA synthase family protein [Dokdonella sp.]HUD41845.1 LTA synthase family protein [Dokdonella sp.]